MGKPEGGPLVGFAEVQGSQMADGVGTGLTPPHAAAFESLTDHLFTGRFNGPRTNLPAVGQVRGVVGAVHVVAQVLRFLTVDFAHFGAARFQVELFPSFQQRRAPLVLQLVTPGLRLLGAGLLVERMERAHQVRHMLTGVIEVEDALCQGKVAMHELFQAVAAIGQGDLLLGRVPTNLRRFAPQLQPQFVEVVKPAKYRT